MRPTWKSGWPPVAAAVFFIVLWQTYVSLGNVEKWFLPGPLDVAKEAAASWDRLWIHVESSLILTISGFGCGVAAALAIGVLLHFSTLLERGLFPLLILTQTIPLVLLGPLLLFWLGYGLQTRVFVVALVCFFPVLIAFLNGLKQTDPSMHQYMKMIGASRWQLFAKLELPNSVSHLFAGLKISATYCVAGASIAEWLGAEVGLGKYIILSKSGFRMDRALLGTLLVVLLSLAFVGLVAALERYLLRYRNFQSEKE